MKALAVDVEPTVFWDGKADDFVARLSEWRNAVAFAEGDGPGQHGRMLSTSPSANGSSGRKVVTQYLQPLGLDEASVTFTDICPVFFVKRSGKASRTGRREQGDAIVEEYDSIARDIGCAPSTLPVRPPAAKLPAMAATEFGDRLVAQLLDASPDLVITLGTEVWSTLLLLPSIRARPPAPKA